MMHIIGSCATPAAHIKPRRVSCNLKEFYLAVEIIQSVAAVGSYLQQCIKKKLKDLKIRLFLGQESKGQIEDF